MTIPKGYKILHSSPNTKVRKLNKSLYGLKQANKHWYSKLADVLISVGYHYSHSDYSLFLKHDNSSLIALLVYVDDIVLIGNNINEITNVKTILNNKFRIKDLGPLRHFLGLEMARSSSSIFLNQHSYILDLLNNTSMLASKPSPTPYNLPLNFLLLILKPFMIRLNIGDS